MFLIFMARRRYIWPNTLAVALRHARHLTVDSLSGYLRWGQGKMSAWVANSILNENTNQYHNLIFVKAENRNSGCVTDIMTS